MERHGKRRTEILALNFNFKKLKLAKIIHTTNSGEYDDEQAELLQQFRHLSPSGRLDC
jgi:hypothetical protein